jgi:hypothetical protein
VTRRENRNWHTMACVQYCIAMCSACLLLLLCTHRHPRDHIHQVSVPAPTDGGSSSSSSAAPGPLWEICEYFMCPEQTGYTSANYQPGPQHDSDYIIKEVTELQQLDSHSMAMTVPTRWGIGSSLWQLQHTWQDSPQGLLVNSSQRVGVVEPGWRPLWYAKWRNALVRGMFARGRDPVWMLEQWTHHCVEEVGCCCCYCLVWLLLRPWMT